MQNEPWRNTISLCRGRWRRPSGFQSIRILSRAALSEGDCKWWIVAESQSLQDVAFLRKRQTGSSLAVAETIDGVSSPSRVSRRIGGRLMTAIETFLCGIITWVMRAISRPAFEGVSPAGLRPAQPVAQALVRSVVDVIRVAGGTGRPGLPRGSWWAALRGKLILCAIAASDTGRPCPAPPPASHLKCARPSRRRFAACG